MGIVVGDDHNLVEEDDINNEPVKHHLRISAAKFLMSIRDGMCLTQRATDAVFQGGKGLVSAMLGNLIQLVRRKVEDGSYVKDIDKIFTDPTLTSPFNGLETQYQQHKFFMEYFNLIEPVERCLRDICVRRIGRGQSKKENFSMMWIY
jgi:hypothetical protein